MIEGWSAIKVTHMYLRKMYFSYVFGDLHISVKANPSIANFITVLSLLVFNLADLSKYERQVLMSPTIFVSRPCTLLCLIVFVFMKLVVPIFGTLKFKIVCLLMIFFLLLVCCVPFYLL